jgi:hypothetical protein
MVCLLVNEDGLRLLQNGANGERAALFEKAWPEGKWYLRYVVSIELRIKVQAHQSSRVTTVDSVKMAALAKHVRHQR